MILGIDIGTSYSSAAALVNGQIRMIKTATGASAFGDSYSLPTAVYAAEGELLLGQAALNRRRADPSRFKNEFKRDFGTTSPYLLGDLSYLPEHFYSELLLHFKKQAEEQTGERVERVCLTHPANYGNTKKRLIEKAAQNAGLLNITLIDEPTAAAAGYAQQEKVENGDILLIYDLGGGTFDAAVIKKTAGGYVHLTEPLGISQCGGMDFDRAVYEDIMRKLGEKGGSDIGRLRQERRFTAMLSEVCVQIKHQLSLAKTHTEPIAVGFDYFDYVITKEELEGMIRSLVTDTCERVKAVLKNAGLVPSDVDRVLLVGGSTRMPLVRKMVGETLERDLSFDADPELAICRGAALSGTTGQTNSGPIHQVAEEAEPAGFAEEKPSGMDGEAPREWIYFGGKDGLEKMLPDGSRLTKLCDDTKVWFLQVAGDWLYYQNYADDCALYKIRTDGAQRTKLTGDKAHYIHVAGPWIYYVNDTDQHTLYKIATDGSRRTKLGSGKAWDVNVMGDWIYFMDFDGQYGLYKVCTDGTNRTKLCDDRAIEIRVVGEWIYYENDGEKALYKIRTNGTQRTKLGGDEAWHMDVAGDWLYYANGHDKGRLYKIRTDGTQRTELGGGDAWNLRVKGDWIFYRNHDDDNALYKIRIDGSQCMKLTDLHVTDFWVD